ncbi:MAG: 30S processome protein Utp24 [Candidatus Heimdallarchaeum endolithica]|uniref:30S processome protein Utp24 n=1 Tax=Candidatus Heimdallarchaeum endolithica TaxID=2876572 RepID=A0A9Y1FMZ0_9ARCH|nr:MAG: 30S processome protein Utp24 [Candidatus Heimdallarchaeum endolithica]
MISVKKRLVFLDSCILMLPAEKKLNLGQIESLPFSSKVVIPEIVIKELQNLVENGKPSVQNKARLALAIAQKFEIIPSRTEGHTDDELVRLAKEYDGIVATTDVNLRKRLHKEGLLYVTLVGKKGLKLVGEI